MNDCGPLGDLVQQNSVAIVSWADYYLEIKKENKDTDRSPNQFSDL